MKKILITGANSYIGTSFEKYMRKWPESYQVDTVDMIDGSWQAKNFSGYDAVFHVAGIAHRKETEENRELFYTVNRDLPIAVAGKAKAEGVAQFVFLSSASVYGINTGFVDADTPLTPQTHYGKSKLAAEQGLELLGDDSFRVAVLRPPMIYGKGCRGNYNALASLARKLPVFPAVKNQRSLLYIENLCEFVRLVLEYHDAGLFFPQNAEYVNTTEMAEQICLCHGKKMKKIPVFPWMLSLAGLFTQKLNKAFGSLVYDQSMSRYKEDYWVADFKTSIQRTEK